MKKLVLTALALTCAASVFAQGTVVFNNRMSGTLVTHVYYKADVQSSVTGNSAIDTPTGAQDWTGYTLLTGSGYSAVLVAAAGADQPISAMSAYNPITTFRTGTAAGQIAGATATLNGITGDVASTVTCAVFAWDNKGGTITSYAAALAAWNSLGTAAGYSNPFNIVGISTTSGAATMTGLTSFNIYVIPEPTTVALAGLGAAALLIFRRRR